MEDMKVFIWEGMTCYRQDAILTSQFVLRISKPIKVAFAGKGKNKGAEWSTSINKGMHFVCERSESMLFVARFILLNNNFLNYFPFLFVKTIGMMS